MPDHPRSRGVYPPEPRGQRGARGSSPLARGLRAGRRPHLLDQRIIPARAGFTDHRGPADRGPRDHPRSRGVYTLTGTTSSSSSGSSPLARGLPSHMGTDAWPEGIIPARAGFTPPPSRRGSSTSDHPRSRGVYTLSAASRGAGGGSSPLARGLQGDRVFVSKEVGIIPARAGFTRRAVRRGRHRRDHPRSRGVYGDPHMIAWATGGSSPLARGLHRRLPLWALALGIIPARAGFTGLAHVGGARGPDHPRSRGVYYEIGSLGMSHSGSSPLARGLRGRPVRRVRAAGIIPARAGFTLGGGAFPLPCGDHPRSRGVYRWRVQCDCVAHGSSPLARGLPWRRLRARPDRGIIPARAGFTGGTIPDGEVGWDHPRSRGVYPSSGS